VPGPPLVDSFRFHGLVCERAGSPFYAGVLRFLAAEVERGEGPIAAVLRDRLDAPLDDAVPLRFIYAVHRLALTGAAADLVARFPTTGGDGDVAATGPAVRDAVIEHAEVIRSGLEHPPQTNEVGRSAALVGGFLAVRAATGLPLRLLELGSSAGLNLLVDRYWFEPADPAPGLRGVGDPTSPVRFVGAWEGGSPPFAAGLEITDRAGCDRAPVDAASPEGRLTLLSAVWPGQDRRFQLLRDALDIAATARPTVDRADAEEWLASQLEAPGAGPEHGVATVVFHSVFAQYLSERQQRALHDTMDRVGRSATSSAPLARVALERSADFTHCELRVTIWPDGGERLLATSGFHLGPVQWAEPGGG
jgi:hypothetical protein